MSVHGVLIRLPLAVVATLGLAVVPGLVAARQAPAPRATVAQDTSDVAGLPVIERPATAPGDPRLVVLLTGDGGFAGGDEGMAAAFNRRGIAVVALDSRRYLETPRTPAEASRDLARVLRHYVAAWRRPDVLIVGYSRGAVIAPFMISALPPALRKRITRLALLGPSTVANFHFHWVDLVTAARHPGDLPVLPELEKLRGTPVVCVYGSHDADAICPTLDPTLARAVRRSGGHAVRRSEGEDVVRLILDDPDGRSGR
jgi:type IV secretory pathway VirJ component